MSQSGEKFLTLSDGRVLAYCENGNICSTMMVIFFHGVFGVGRIDRLSATLRSADVHFLSPTLPGWGNSSPRPTSISYAASLVSDINELIDHLHPNDSSLRIYVAGGSYGSVAAQIIFGAPFDLFPHGRHIAGCLLISPFSPFRWHRDYTKAMTWQNYISVGPPAQFIPFRLVPRMISLLLKPRLQSVAKAEVLLRSLLFDKASEIEKTALSEWRVKEGLTEGQFEREMAENAVKSVSKTWSGYEEVSDVLHADWGFCPDQLDEAHCKRPILVVASTEDELGPDMATWLARHYKNSSLKWVQGGHVAAVPELEEIWRQLLVNSPAAI